MLLRDYISSVGEAQHNLIKAGEALVEYLKEIEHKYVDLEVKAERVKGLDKEIADKEEVLAGLTKAHNLTQKAYDALRAQINR